MTAPNPIVRLLIDGQTYPLDMNKFMLSEAIALEEDWSLKVDEFTAMVASGNPPWRVVAAMVWLAKTRALAAERGVTFPEARRAHPPETFDVDVVALKVEADGPVPENPTGSGTRTRTTRTTPATSASKRKKAA